MLKSNIKIFSELELDSGFLRLSDSVEKVTQLDGFHCTSKTFLPASGWRKLTKEEWDTMIEHEFSKQKIGSSIRLFKLPDEIINKCKELGIEDVKSDDDLGKLQVNKSTDFHTVKTKIKNFVRESYCFNEEKFDDLDIVTGLPNLKSVSFYDEEETYVGLHIDNWDLLPIPLRNKSRTLFCTNLGKEDRFFMLIKILY
jgi:hypothetical protein